MNTEKFHIGEIIYHKSFGYRGVIFAVDLTFSSSEEWYNTMAKSKPPKDKPWYHVLVDNAGYTTYVAERNLGLSDNSSQINHPFLGRFFARYDGQRYFLRTKTT